MKTGDKCGRKPHLFDCLLIRQAEPGLSQRHRMELADDF